MNCPLCESPNTKVFNVRKKYNKEKQSYDKVYRRRRCLNCDHKFTSYEFEIGQLMEAFDIRIKNPHILDAIKQVIELEFPRVKYPKCDGGE